VLLKQDSGEYACIAEDKPRYNLGEVKEELMAAMGLYMLVVLHLTCVISLMCRRCWSRTVEGMLIGLHINRILTRAAAMSGCCRCC
jgi:hypothetical protein